jgi:hypothetical protein
MKNKICDFKKHGKALKKIMSDTDLITLTVIKHNCSNQKKGWISIKLRLQKEVPWVVG